MPAHPVGQQRACRPPRIRLPGGACPLLRGLSRQLPHCACSAPCSANPSTRWRHPSAYALLWPMCPYLLTVPVSLVYVIKALIVTSALALLVPSLTPVLLRRSRNRKVLEASSAQTKYHRQPASRGLRAGLGGLIMIWIWRRQSMPGFREGACRAFTERR